MVTRLSGIFIILSSILLLAACGQVGPNASAPGAGRYQVTGAPVEAAVTTGPSWALSASPTEDTNSSVKLAMNAAIAYAKKTMHASNPSVTEASQGLFDPSDPNSKVWIVHLVGDTFQLPPCPSGTPQSTYARTCGSGVTASVYQSETNIQIWWEVGSTSIRLESGGPAGTTLLGKDVMLDIARSMRPVASSSGLVTLPSNATIQTAGDATLKAKTLLAAIGMPQPTGVDSAAPIWSVTFPHGMEPDGCPALGNAVCNGGAITVIIDAQSGNILAWQGPTGEWKQP
jgi:hypothetical protein